MAAPAKFASGDAMGGNNNVEDERADEEAVSGCVRVCGTLRQSGTAVEVGSATGRLAGSKAHDPIPSGGEGTGGGAGGLVTSNDDATRAELQPGVPLHQMVCT